LAGAGVVPAVFQSLSDPLFAVPFLAALAGGVVGVAVGVGTFWWLIRIAVPVYRSDHPKAGGRCGNDLQQSV